MVVQRKFTQVTCLLSGSHHPFPAGHLPQDVFEASISKLRATNTVARLVWKQATCRQRVIQRVSSRSPACNGCPNLLRCRSPVPAESHNPVSQSCRSHNGTCASRCRRFDTGDSIPVPATDHGSAPISFLRPSSERAPRVARVAYVVASAIPTEAGDDQPQSQRPPSHLIQSLVHEYAHD